MNNSESAVDSTSVARSNRSASTLAHARPARRFAQSLVLFCPEGCSTQLGQLLANFILDGVRHVYLAGPDGGHIKALIDTILIKGGFNAPIATTWYEGKTLEGVVAFARSYCRQPPGGMQVVYL